MSATRSNESSQTDWAWLADPSDADIDYSDIPPLGDDFFREAIWRLPKDQEAVTLRLDRDVLAWFKTQSEEYQKRINAVLRAYKEAHESV